MSRHRAEVEAALAGILAGGRPADFESPTLDFREDRPGSLGDTEKMLAEAVICFANAGGGTVVLGVRDKAVGAEALVGTALSPERLQERVYHLTNPPIAVVAEPHPRHPSVLLVTVAQSADVHADTRGRATRRIGLGCEPMSPAQIAALVSERRGVDHSAAVSTRAIDEVAPEAIAVTVIVVPERSAVTLALRMPEIVWPIASVPAATAVTVSVVPLIAPVKSAAATPLVPAVVHL